jgi:WD40 repeat protein
VYCVIAGTVNCVGFNDEGTVALSGSIDSTIRAWDYRSRKNDPIQVGTTFCSGRRYVIYVTGLVRT